MTTPGREIDRSTYEAWVDTHAASLYRFAYRLTGRREVAEEILQETFLEAWRGRSALRDPDAARAWLFSILRHRFHRHLRSKPAVGLVTLEMAERTPSGSTHTDAIDARDALQAGLDALDEAVRLPFVLVFIEGRSCREASEVLGIPFGTVLSRLSRARAGIRQRLHAAYGPETRTGQSRNKKVSSSPSLSTTCTGLNP